MTTLNIPFVEPRARFFDADGNPLSGGRVSFYDAGTTTLKEVYTDPTLDTPATNPHVLDAEGYVRDGGIWLAEGEYKIVVEELIGVSTWSELWTMDRIPGSKASASGTLTTEYIETIADLKALGAGAFDLVYVAGYFAAADGGGGWFAWYGSASNADDGGAWISPSSAPSLGRWKRIFNGENYMAAFWGCLANNPDPIDGNLILAADYAEAQGVPLTIGAGNLTFGDDVTLDQNCKVIIYEGAYFTAASAYAVKIQTREIEVLGQSAIVNTTYVDLWLDPLVPMVVRPEYWGAVGDGVANDIGAFAALSGSYGNSTLYLSRNYNIDGTGSMISSISLQRFYVEVLGKQLTSNVVLVFEYEYTFVYGLTNYFAVDYDAFEPASGVPLYPYHIAVDITGSRFEDLYNAVTAAGTRVGTLIWNGSKNVTFGTSVIDQNKLRSVFFEASQIRLNDEVEFGYITAGKYQLFSTASAGTLNTITGKIYPIWFGANADGTDAGLGLEICFRTLFSGFNPVIDGEGNRYSCSKPLNLDGDGVTLTDITIDALTGIGASNYLLSVNDNATLINIFLRLNVVGLGVLNLSDNTKSYTLVRVVTSFGNSSRLEFSRLRLIDCEFLSGTQVDIVGNTAGSILTMTGCYFTGTICSLVNPSKWFLSGNNFVRTTNSGYLILIDSELTNYIVSGLNVKNNNFEYASGGTPTAIYVDAPIYASGHRAEVYDNYFVNCAECSTRFYLNASATGLLNFPGAQAMGSSYTLFRYILPFVDIPENPTIISDLEGTSIVATTTSASEDYDSLISITGLSYSVAIDGNKILKMHYYNYSDPGGVGYLSGYIDLSMLSRSLH